MSYYATQTEVSFDYPTSSARGTGGFDKDSDEVIGRWVQLAAGGRVELVADNAKPIGVITRLDTTKVAVALGPFVKGKQNGTTAIPVGSGITGATKAVVNAGTPERGFVKAAGTTTAAHAINRTGVVVDSAATTADSEGDASTEVLMWV